MKIRVLVMVMVLFFSCNKTAKIPKELYNREEMAHIMKDLYVLEYKVKELNLGTDSVKKVYDHYESKYYQENEIDTARYEKSFQFYLNQPEHLEYIYTIIADSLSLQDRMMKIEN